MITLSRGDLVSINCTLFTRGDVFVYLGLFMGMYHIGVGSNVVCSTSIGNARASVRGTDDKWFPRFIFLSSFTENYKQYYPSVGDLSEFKSFLLWQVYKRM